MIIKVVIILAGLYFISGIVNNIHAIFCDELYRRINLKYK